MTSRHALDESFGRQQVATDARRASILQVFDVIAPRYDLMNDLMGCGIHRLSKRTLEKRCRGIHGKLVDLAGGTGDVARLLANPQRIVTVCDPSLPMMLAGKKVGEAEALPFASAPH